MCLCDGLTRDITGLAACLSVHQLRHCSLAVCMCKDQHDVKVGVLHSMASLVNGEKAGEHATNDFCEKHATKVAQNFVREFIAFDRNTPSTGRSRDPFDYARKFSESFLRHFEYELKRSSFTIEHRAEVNNSGHDGAASAQDTRSTGDHQNGDTDDYAEQDSSPERGVSPTRKHPKGILRRLSFRNIRKSKLFKQGSEEAETGGDSNHLHPSQTHYRKGKKHDKKEKLNSRSAWSNGDVCVKKDGIVNVLTGEDSRGKSRWERTRLVLLQTTGGNLLEFYSPPKVSCFQNVKLFFFIFFIKATLFIS